MRKLSEYFKAADVPQRQTTSASTSMQMLGDPEDSPLSDYISCPSPTPPPPQRIVANSGQRGGSGGGVTGKSKNTSILTVAQEGASGGVSSLKGVKAKKPRAIIPDSEGEETDDSLEDLDLLLKPKAAKAAKPEKTSKKQKPELPINQRLAPDIPTYTFSLDALLSAKAKDTEREQTLQRAEALLASVDDEDHVTVPQQLSDKGIVDAAVGNEAGGKVLDMLNRREAWRVEYTWFFFRRPEGSTQPKPRNTFPTDFLTGWSARMKEPTARHQMFLSGCVQDMCVVRPSLPTEAVSWLLDELVLENREDLSFAYARTLEACHSQVRQLLDPVRISKLFELLGATEDAVNPSSPVIMEVASGAKATRRRDGDVWNLKLLVRFIGNIAVQLSHAAVHAAVAILIRLSFDDMFTSCGDLVIDIEQSIYSLLMSRPESDGENAWGAISLKLAENFTTTFTEPRAQVRLLKILPISSPRTHLFRRRLALAFLFNNHKYFTVPSSQLIIIDNFSRLLEEPQFTIKHDTDYSKLKALVEMLDVALDDGGMPSVDHSKRVESVATGLKDMSSRIRDTGMASLERTEAKQAIELTQFRLQFAVAKGRKGVSVLEQHFLKDDFGDKAGKKQILLNFGGSSSKK